MKAYFARYGGVQAYMRGDPGDGGARRQGRDALGAGAPPARALEPNRNLRENARRMAINARIQGTAADVLKLAMIAVDRRLRAEHPGAELLLTVHDELVLEVPAAEIEAVAALVRGEMEAVAELDVPLVAEAGWGATWYDAKG